MKPENLEKCQEVINLYSQIKVQMKCFFRIAESERAANIRKITVYRFLISLLVRFQSYKGLKMSSFRSKSARKSCRNQSKSIKVVTACTGHVDGMRK